MQMRGSLQKGTALSSNPPPTFTSASTGAMNHHSSDAQQPTPSPPTRRPPSPPEQPPQAHGSARKRSYGMRLVPQDSPTSQLTADLDAAAEDEEDGGSPHGSKRQRPSPKYPLNVEPSPAAPGSIRRRIKRLSRASLRGTPRSDAKSRFMEGSMRDRESQRPPDQYLFKDGDIAEDEIQDFKATSEDPGSERPRSGVFRFGRAIANVFNPATVLHGMFGREKSSSVSPSKSDLNDDRKTKAEKAYADLMQDGAFEPHRRSAASSVRDSGIELESGRTSEEQKRNSVVIDSSATTPATDIFPLPESPTDNPLLESGHGFRRRASATNMHKLKSHFSIKNLRREAATPPTTTAGSAPTHRIKKKASKKDLNKQKKLTKRISNLESQLERARRELAQTQEAPDVPLLPEMYQQDLSSTPGVASVSLISDVSPYSHHPPSEDPYRDSPVPRNERASDQPVTESKAYIRSRFVPGALASLPSERLLLAPTRALPVTPTDTAVCSPTKSESIRERNDSLDTNAVLDTLPEDTEPVEAGKTRKSSIPRASRPGRPKVGFVDPVPGEEDAKIENNERIASKLDLLEPQSTDGPAPKMMSLDAQCDERPTTKAKPAASQRTPKYRFVDSSDSGSGSGSETSTPSSHQGMQFKLRRHRSSQLPRASADAYASRSAASESAFHSNLSTINLASMANITDGTSTHDLSEEISANDLRGLYTTSAFAQARRMRATGPNSPARRASGGASSASAAGNAEPAYHGVNRKRSASPRQTRSRGARRVSSRKKNAPVTATPGSGDGRGEIIPPLPTNGHGKDQASGTRNGNYSKGKGNGKGLASDSTWEGWGEDVF